ncbi:cytochrome P450 [Embleya sp. NPDC001921]
MSPEHIQVPVAVDDTGVMPFVPSSPLEEPAPPAGLRSRPGPVRLRTGTGDAGWVVTRRDDLKSLCTDARIGRSHPDPDGAPRQWNAAVFAPQANHATEREDHRRWRRAVVPRFGAPRMDAPRRRAGELCAELLDAVIAAGPPGDLHAMLAQPFAARLNFEVLGIPHRDHERMRAWSDDMRAGNDRPRANAAHDAITQRLADLLEHKRERPADDALTDLATAHDDDGPLTRAQALEGARHLFFGGYETVAARISHGILALLAHPDHYRALAEHRAPARAAVEEILRFAVPGGSWIPRYALADIDFRGAPYLHDRTAVQFVRCLSKVIGGFRRPPGF